MVPEPFRGERMRVSLPKIAPHFLYSIQVTCDCSTSPSPWGSAGLHVLVLVRCCWLLPNCIWVSPLMVSSAHGRNSSSHLQIVVRFLREIWGIIQGDLGSFSIGFTLPMRDSWGPPSSPFYHLKSVCSHRICCKGGGTMNLHGSQVQQKTMNPGSLFSLARTDVHQISTRFNLWSWLFHQNSQRAEKPFLTLPLCLKQGKKQILSGRGNRLHMMMATEKQECYLTAIFGPGPVLTVVIFRNI